MHSFNSLKQTSQQTTELFSDTSTVLLTDKFESYCFTKSIWRSKPSLQRKHIPETQLKIANIHVLVGRVRRTDSDHIHGRKWLLSMEDNTVKSPNLFQSPKVYWMPLTVADTRLDTEERKPNMMLICPLVTHGCVVGCLMFCFLLLLVFFLFSSEKYVKGINKIEARVQLKKKKKLHCRVSVYFHCFICYIGIWAWSMDVQSQNDRWGHSPPRYQLRGSWAVGFSVLKPRCWANLMPQFSEKGASWTA